MKPFLFLKLLLFGKSISAKDVFTPSSSATLTYIKRKAIDSQIDRALETTGKQLVIYGHSGSGKSTLVKNI